jgi:glycosyltransferase involved in cell wall biosynthesis
MSSGASTARGPAGQSAAPSICLVPAFQAEATVGRVVEELRRALGLPVLVVDDGSTDGTAEAARRAGGTVVSHGKNRGKGAALETGLAEARALGFATALAVDADGQHPVESARAVLEASPDPGALVLGVRDLVRDGAPRANRISNGISNFFLSRFTGRALRDTQCGLRRYPVEATLALGARAAGYAYEAEILIRAIRAGIPVVEKTVRVFYPPEDERVTHFHSVKDPARIVATVVATLWDLRQH